MGKIVLLWALAALFLANSLYISIRTKFNIGTLLMWLCTLALVLHALFPGPVNAICATGPGRLLALLLWAGLGLFALLMVFVALQGRRNDVQNTESAIIVLGAGLRGDRPSSLLQRRLEKALALWQANPGALVVVTGGQGPGESIPEAVAMARWLEARGVPPARLIREDKSVSTEENLRFAHDLLALRGLGPQAPVALVSTGFHCYRARCYARLAGFRRVRAAGAPMAFYVLLPNCMREALAVLYLWVFRGRALRAAR